MLIDERPKRHCYTCGKGPLGMTYVTQEETPGFYCNSTCLAKGYFKHQAEADELADELAEWKDCGFAPCKICIPMRKKLEPIGDKMTDTKFVEKREQIEVEVKPGLLVKKDRDIYIVAYVKQADVAAVRRYCLINLRTGKGYESFYTDTIGYWADKMTKDGFTECESVNLPDDVELF